MTDAQNIIKHPVEYISPSKLGTKRNPCRRKILIVGKDRDSISRGISIPPKWLLKLFNCVGEDEKVLDGKTVGIRYGKDTLLGQDVITIFRG